MEDENELKPTEQETLKQLVREHLAVKDQQAQARAKKLTEAIRSRYGKQKEPDGI